jgi:hypothetical protein
MSGKQVEFTAGAGINLTPNAAEKKIAINLDPATAAEAQAGTNATKPMVPSTANVLIRNSLRASVEAASGGKVTVLYDDQGNPSHMRRFSAMYIKDLYRQYFTSDDAWNASPFKPIENEVHPVFMKNGVRIKELLVGQFQACEVKGRACSLPGQAPRVDLNFGQALALCKSKGAGWTMSTVFIWGFLQALCLRLKYQPRGNTFWGASNLAHWENGLRVDNGIPGNNTGNGLIKTGTGPTSWAHDGTDSGVYDLVGNVWEMQTLMKLVDGKIIMPSDNNIDLAENLWPDTGVRYDSTGGTADGTGINLVAGDVGNPVMSDAITKYTGLPGSNDTYGTAIIDAWNGFRSVAKKSGYDVPVLMVLAGLAPVSLLGGVYETNVALDGSVDIINNGTRFPITGSDWYANWSAGGLGALRLTQISIAHAWWFGFRPAFLLV